jgi:hypothetical protein
LHCICAERNKCSGSDFQGLARRGSHYQSYGCGEFFGDPIPPDLCSGAVKIRVLLTTPLGELPGIMTVI